MKRTFILSTMLLMVFAIISCVDRPDTVENAAPELPATVYSYAEDLSDLDISLPFDNTPSGNPVTDHGATLGRVLFYDPNLSINNQISCGTCHKQALSFADEFDQSTGFESVKTTRNSPAVLNMRFSQKFFWDMSSEILEEQVLLPVVNHIEMGMEDLDYLSEKLQNLDYYPELFEKAFGTPQVSPDRISKAMAQFVRSINSFDSKFDRESKQDFSGFNPLEKEGLDVFINSGCNGCHTVVSAFVAEDEIFFVDDDTGYGGTGIDVGNIGLQLVYDDPGMANGVFKIPSLRNLKYTSPYMHDGRFVSLDQVIDHYDHGVVAHTHLDSRLKDEVTGLPKKLNLNPIQKEALKAFLLTLTDDSVITDPRFSDPFRK